jgi:histidinol-phosphate aminotransferase
MDDENDAFLRVSAQIATSDLAGPSTVRAEVGAS